jgi:HSP20 family protein
VDGKRIEAFLIRGGVVLLAAVAAIFLVAIGVLASAAATGNETLFNSMAWLIPLMGVVSLVLALGGTIVVRRMMKDQASGVGSTKTDEDDKETATVGTQDVADQATDQTGQVGQAAKSVQDTEGQATDQAGQVAGQVTDQAGQAAQKGQDAAGTTDASDHEKYLRGKARRFVEAVFEPLRAEPELSDYPEEILQRQEQEFYERVVNLLRERAEGSPSGAQRLSEQADRQQEVRREFRIQPQQGAGQGSRSTQEITAWAPAIDVIQRDDDLIVRADLPGVRSDRLEMTVGNGVLTISGWISEEKEEREGYLVRERRERRPGTFRRILQLPQEVNTEDVKSMRFENGVLEIVIGGPATGAVTDAIAETATFPIPGYDEMNVAEVSDRLNDLSAEEMQLVRDYEERNKRRETLLEQMDRRIRST